MIVAPLPPDEPERLATLKASGLLDAPPDAALDAMVRLVARAFRVPICLVSLIDEHRQFFLARFGLAERETPRDCSFCAHLLWWPQTLIVDDAKDDDRFHYNPLVLDAPRVRFYAGHPLRLGGRCVGSLCLLDTRPARRFACDEQSILAGAAAAVEERLFEIVAGGRP